MDAYKKAQPARNISTRWNLHRIRISSVYTVGAQTAYLLSPKRDVAVILPPAEVEFMKKIHI